MIWNPMSPANAHYMTVPQAAARQLNGTLTCRWSVSRISLMALSRAWLRRGQERWSSSLIRGPWVIAIRSAAFDAQPTPGGVGFGEFVDAVELLA
jgi:hypothetical protein